MKKIDGSELLLLATVKMNSDWEDMCKKYIKDDVKPLFSVVPEHSWILSVASDELYENKARSYSKQFDILMLERQRYDADVLLNNVIHIYVLNEMCRIDSRKTDKVFIYNESMCMFAETLAQIMVDIHDPVFLIKFLEIKQKLMFGQFMYHRSIYKDCDDKQTFLNIQVIEASRMKSQFDKIKNKGYSPSEERRHYYTDMTVNAETLKNIGMTVDEVLELEQLFDNIIKRSRTFDIDEKLYAALNSIKFKPLWGSTT
jgi:hypothetical protein